MEGEQKGGLRLCQSGALLVPRTLPVCTSRKPDFAYLPTYELRKRYRARYCFTVSFPPGLTYTFALSDNRKISERAIDADWFWSALGAGLFEKCLAHVRRPDSSGSGEASLNCRLAEALMWAGRCAEAVECCRRAFPAIESDEG